MINGILWRFRTGAPWRGVPERHGPRPTLYNRFVRWRAAGSGTGCWKRFFRRLRRRYRDDRQLLRSRSPARRRQMRGLASRYDRRPDNFPAALELAAVRIWIKTL